MIRRALLLLLLAAPAWGDSVETPNGTTNETGTSNCDDTNAHLRLDDDPDSPDGVWCTATNNNTNPIIVLSMTDPGFSLDESAGAQSVRVFLQEFDDGQSGTAELYLVIRDGSNCTDIHEQTAPQNVPEQSGSIVTYTWTAAGVSSAADVCVRLRCDKSGGSPSTRQTCDYDAMEWIAVEASGPTPTPTPGPAGNTFLIGQYKQKGVP